MDLTPKQKMKLRWAAIGFIAAVAVEHQAGDLVQEGLDVLHGAKAAVNRGASSPANSWHAGSTSVVAQQTWQLGSGVRVTVPTGLV